MTTLAVVLSITSLAVAIASLTWQVVSWMHSGSRIRVENGWALMSPGLLDPGEGLATATVTVRNVGRTAVSVTGWGFDLADGRQAVDFGSDPWQSRVPRRLDAGEEETWHFPVARLLPIAASCDPPSPHVVGFARLGTGGRPTARKGLDLRIASTLNAGPSAT